MNTRLEQFLAAENLSQTQFAESIDVARAGVSHLLSGRNKPSYDFIQAVMKKYPRLNIEWLILGKGKMYRSQEESSAAAGPFLFPEDEDDSSISEESFKVEEDPVHIGNITPMTESKTSENPMQSTVKQRSVSKIIILFNDGSFQEIQHDADK